MVESSDSSGICTPDARLVVVCQCKPFQISTADQNTRRLLQIIFQRIAILNVRAYVRGSASWNLILSCICEIAISIVHDTFDNGRDTLCRRYHLTVLVQTPASFLEHRTRHYRSHLALASRTAELVLPWLSYFYKAMTSHDLLEMLGSGAVFGGKARHAESGRRECKARNSVNFFASPASAGARCDKRQHKDLSDSRESMPPKRTRAADSSGCLKVARPSIATQPDSDTDFALFKRKSQRDTGSDSMRTDEAQKIDLKLSSIHQQEVASFRRRMGIKVRGEEIVDPMETFPRMPQGGTGDEALQTRRALLRNVEESTWKEPTPVQMQAVPILVAGRDLLAAAPTGSGKTAAFVMPMILRLGAQQANGASGIRGILLAPTRELAAQIHRDVVRLSRGRKLRICLLTKAGAAKAAAATGADGNRALAVYDIIVSTPMRLVSLVREGSVNLASVEMAVLDEADKLFDAGSASGVGDKAFVGQVDEILAACSHKEIQRALFSATIGQQVSPTVRQILSSILYHMFVGLSIHRIIPLQRGTLIRQWKES